MKKYIDWLENLKIVWEKKDLLLLENILHEDVEFYESPAKEPLTSKIDIVKQWEMDLKDQENISFDFEVLISDEKFCIANWKSVFHIKDEKFYYDGIFQISQDEDGKWKSFRQWYVRE